MKESEGNKGVKGFDLINGRLNCRGYEFELGKEYKEKGAKLCYYGFHYCKDIEDVLKFYPVFGHANSITIYAEVTALSRVHETTNKCCTSRIRIDKLLEGKVGPYYFKYGRFHCEDKPAYVDKQKECWLSNGLLHRTNGPAKVFVTGSEHWYRDGKIHREDGPALINTKTSAYNISKAWYKEDKLHRIDGPAIEYLNGDTEWYVNGERIDNPKNIPMRRSDRLSKKNLDY